MTDARAPYNMQSIETMLGMGRSAVTRLINAGYVTPSRGARNEFRFTFQDVVLLRTAFQLQAADVPARKLLRSLGQLRARLPAEMPLSGLRVQAIGDNVVVREGGAQWEPDSGQLLLDFEVAPRNGAVAIIDPPQTGAPSRSAADWYQAGRRLEATDRAAAIDAYRRALALDPTHLHATVDLGALLCEAGHCQDALVLYERAVQLAPEDAEVHFNGAIALEDLGMDRDAIRSYERCLELAPYMADAHYNAARLFERMGDAQGTLRHFNAYRRLTRVEGQPDA